MTIMEYKSRFVGLRAEFYQVLKKTGLGGVLREPDQYRVAYIGDYIIPDDAKAEGKNFLFLQLRAQILRSKKMCVFGNGDALVTLENFSEATSAARAFVEAL